MRDRLASQPASTAVDRIFRVVHMAAIKSKNMARKRFYIAGHLQIYSTVLFLADVQSCWPLFENEKVIKHSLFEWSEIDTLFSTAAERIGRRASEKKTGFRILCQYFLQMFVPNNSNDRV